MPTSASAVDRAWTRSVPEVVEALATDPSAGLSPDEAARRAERYGPNELQERGGRSPYRILWEQFTSTMVLILIAAAVLSAFLGKPLETTAISAIVVLFAILGFAQEYRAERAMAALRQLAVPSVRVRRDGTLVELSARELVPGDVVLLEAGAAVPADLRLVESANLRIQEAALTGESEPVEKSVEAVASDEAALGDRVDMAYVGTSVAYGRGAGVVVATGMATELGRIADLIQGVESHATPLQRQLDRLGKQLAVLGVLVALLLAAIGLLRGETVGDMILTAISVAVAVVPEGLPAVVTITLALGAQRMLRRRALVRKLPAVETLGAVTTICSDKTGTLTQNRMTVTVVDVAGHYLELLGPGGAPAPALTDHSDRSDAWRRGPPTVGLALAIGALCNDATLRADEREDRPRPVGDPTEGALLLAAHEAGLESSSIASRLPRIDELPFDAGRKRMTTVHALPSDRGRLSEAVALLRELPGDRVAFTKGSVDGLLEVSSRVLAGDASVALDDAWRARIQRANEQMAAKGTRVLGLAIRPLDGAGAASEAELERELTFVGLVGMIDPPRREVRSAIRTCRTAGIRPVMITGDHPLTARFIAYDLGISEDGQVRTGVELDRMSAEELSATVEEVSVYARVTPEHKLRIVEALQARGEVVAMTGDGVNDSPALKRADIGVAMGIAGTDVAKEASQMVLLDDNFATIVAAVEEGRGIYANLRRFVRFSIAGNVGKVLVMLLAPLAGIAVALQPLQLLWLNLLTDGLLGIGLGVEPGDGLAMRRPPRRKDAAFLDRATLVHIAWVGTLIGLFALALGYAFLRAQGAEDPAWQTMIFTSLAFMQVGQALAARSDERSLFALGLRTNPTLLVLVAVTVLLQLAAIYLPFLATFFRVEPLTGSELLVAAASGVAVFAVLELRKAWKRRRGEAGVAAVVS